MADEAPEDDVEEGAATVAADPVVVRDRRRRDKKLAEDRAMALRGWLATAEGRELFSHIMHELCGVYSPINARFGDSGIHFLEGARAVGLSLHQLALQAAPEQYMVLMNENIIKR